MGHHSTQTTERYYARVREDAAIVGLNRLFEDQAPEDGRDSQQQHKTLIEEREYMSGYA